MYNVIVAHSPRHHVPSPHTFTAFSMLLRVVMGGKAIAGNFIFVMAWWCLRRPAASRRQYRVHQHACNPAQPCNAAQGGWTWAAR